MRREARPAAGPSFFPGGGCSGQPGLPGPQENGVPARGPAEGHVRGRGTHLQQHLAELLHSEHIVLVRVRLRPQRSCAC